MLRAVALAASALALCSCALVTGSTSGYVVEAGAPAPACGVSPTGDAGEAGAGGDAGGTGAAGDASCTGLVQTCTSAANCDAGKVCCVVATTSAIIETCSSLPCPANSVQACQSNAECGRDGGACTFQKCSFGSTSDTLGLCNSVPLICTPE